MSKYRTGPVFLRQCNTSNDLQRSLAMAQFNRPHFLFVVTNNYVSILYRFRDIQPFNVK